MLVLSRKQGEGITIGSNVKVTIVEIKGKQVRLGIDAPPDLLIYREEVYAKILNENRIAANPDREKIKNFIGEIPSFIIKKGKKSGN